MELSLEHYSPRYPKDKYRSDHVQEYMREMKLVEEQAQKSYQQKKHALEVNRIKEISDPKLFVDAPTVSTTSVDRGAAVIRYQVAIGSFTVEIVMLNIDTKAMRNLGRPLAAGTFGKILEIKGDDDKLFVAKRIRFRNQQLIRNKGKQGEQFTVNANMDEIRQVLIEYAINKICSALGIAPQINPSSQNGFDLICYRDSIEFFMEKCSPAEDFIGYKTLANCEIRLKYCLKVLHLLKIIHKDIKPSNIMYSKSIKDFVLCDFGLSQSVGQSLGYKSFTFREGSLKYMSPQMLSLSPGEEGWIDLYYNDLYSLKRSMISFQNPFRFMQQKNGNPNSHKEFYHIVRLAFKIYMGCKIVKPAAVELNSSLLRFFPELIGSKQPQEHSFELKYLLSSIDFYSQLGVFLDNCMEESSAVFIKIQYENMSNKIFGYKYKSKSVLQNYLSTFKSLAHPDFGDKQKACNVCYVLFYIYMKQHADLQNCKELAKNMGNLINEDNRLSEEYKKKLAQMQLFLKIAQSHLSCKSIIQLIDHSRDDFLIEVGNYFLEESNFQIVWEIFKKVSNPVNFTFSYVAEIFIKTQNSQCIEYLRQKLQMVDPFLYPSIYADIVLNLSKCLEIINPKSALLLCEASLSLIPREQQAQIFYQMINLTIGSKKACELAQKNCYNIAQTRGQGKNYLYANIYLALCVSAIGCNERSLQILQYAIPRLVLVLGSNHKDVIQAIKLFFSNCQKTKQFEKPRNMSFKIIDDYKSSINKNYLVQYLNIIASSYELELQQSTDITFQQKSKLAKFGLEYYRQIIDIVNQTKEYPPNYFSFYSGIGICYKYFGQIKLAYQAFEESFSCPRPKDINLYIKSILSIQNLIQSCFSLDKTDRAIGVISEFICQQPISKKCMINKALALVKIWLYNEEFFESNNFSIQCYKILDDPNLIIGEDELSSIFQLSIKCFYLKKIHLSIKLLSLVLKNTNNTKNKNIKLLFQPLTIDEIQSLTEDDKQLIICGKCHFLLAKSFKFLTLSNNFMQNALKALTIFSHLSQKYSRIFEFVYQLSEVLLLLKRYQEAYDCLAKIILKNQNSRYLKIPNSIIANFGIICYMLGYLKKAAFYLEKLYYCSDQALIFYCKYLCQQGRVKKLVQVLQNTKKKQSQSSFIRKLQNLINLKGKTILFGFYALQTDCQKLLTKLKKFKSVKQNKLNCCLLNIILSKRVFLGLTFLRRKQKQLFKSYIHSEVTNIL